MKPAITVIGLVLGILLIGCGSHHCNNNHVLLKWYKTRVHHFNGENTDLYFFPDTLPDDYYLEYQFNENCESYLRLLRNNEELGLYYFDSKDQGLGIDNGDFQIYVSLQESSVGTDTIRYTASSVFPFDEGDFPEIGFIVLGDAVQNYFYLVEE